MEVATRKTARLVVEMKCEQFLKGRRMQQDLDSRAFVVELTLSDQFLTCMRETYSVLNAPGAPMRTSMVVKPSGPRQAIDIDEQRSTRNSAGAPCTPLAK